MCDEPDKFLKSYKRLINKKNKVYVGIHPKTKKKVVVSNCEVSAAPIFDIMEKVYSKVPDGIVKPICRGKNYIYTEYINGVTLKDYIFSPSSTKRGILKVIYSTLLTLSKLRAKVPGFRHNDLHLENVMVDKTKPNNPRSVIIDFDLSIINKGGKKYDNPTYNNAEQRSHYKKNWGIYPGNDHRYDAHYFLNCIYGVPDSYLPVGMKNFIRKYIPDSFLGFGGPPTKKGGDIRPELAKYNIFNYRLQPASKGLRFRSISSIIIDSYFDGIVSWFSRLKKGKISARDYYNRAIKSGKCPKKVDMVLVKLAGHKRKCGHHVDERVLSKRCKRK